MEQTRITDSSFTAEDLIRAQRDIDGARRRFTVAVDEARREGWSWDRMGSVLGVPGETLRRRHMHPAAEWDQPRRRRA